MTYPPCARTSMPFPAHPADDGTMISSGASKYRCSPPPPVRTVAVSQRLLPISASNAAHKVGRVLGRDGLVLDYAPRCQATSGHPSRYGPNWVVRSANYDSGSIAYSLCSWTQATPVSGVSVLLRDDPNQLSSHGSPSHANHAAHPRTVSRSPRHDGAGVFSVV
jgi:hypothetical protein